MSIDSKQYKDHATAILARVPESAIMPAVAKTFAVPQTLAAKYASGSKATKSSKDAQGRTKQQDA